MRQGMGVRWLRLMRDMLRGMCPFLAPTKNNLKIGWKKGYKHMRDMLRGMCPFLAPTKNSLNNDIQQQWCGWTDAEFEEYECRDVGRNWSGSIMGFNNQKNKIEFSCFSTMLIDICLILTWTRQKFHHWPPQRWSRQRRRASANGRPNQIICWQMSEIESINTGCFFTLGLP